MMPTIPAFYSKNCGIAPRPTALFSLVTESKYHSYGPFSNALCVSDILKENNYHVYYVMGGELTDEGAKDFFDAHPIDAAVGKYELLRLGYSQMGTAYFIPDLSLYEYSKRILSEVKDEPFALYIVTANTHGPKNDLYRVEPECEKKYNDPRDVFLCLDKISFDFVKWCQAQPWYENTVIYLIGDHLTLPASIFMNKQNIKNHPHRQIYTLMLDGVHSNKVIKKEFTQLDFAPTFLESIGFVSPKFGLGYSLFRDTPTLVEKLGEKTFVEELQKSTDDFHKIVNGITSNKEE